MQKPLLIDRISTSCQMHFMNNVQHVMKRSVSALAFLVLASSVLAACSETASLRRPSSPVQRCINMGGALEAPNEGEWGYTIRMEDIDRIKAAGFDTIRLPVQWSAHAGTWGGYQIEDHLLDRTDEVINYALSQDLKVILDVHHYYDLNMEPAKHERRLESIWKQLASHYESYPDTLIFEVLNEPNTNMTAKRTDALNKRIVRQIRQSQPHRWIILATAEWGSLTGLLESAPPADSRVILSWHYYDPFSFTHQGADFFKPTPPVGTHWGTKADMDRAKADFDRAAAFRDLHHQPLLLGEFGVYDAAPMEDRARWTRAVRELAESNEFGWCHWSFSSNFRVYDPEKEAWIEPIRAALLGD
ncbi:glycoside hydrolase [Hyphomonas oceanitis SCH89]|uniref:Glycoside hydrolase n=2 Tax=Hyphomonas oceanitis TaxID=81033 RepID=A0A059G736_9PROT|nr:glycoside hydrolase [Hyphomonas oceanitis SCH89]